MRAIQRIACAVALLGSSIAFAEDASDAAAQEEADNQQINGVLGQTGVDALNQKETKDLKKRVLKHLTAFRQDGRAEKNSTVWTTGYYSPSSTDVEVNLTYFKKLSDNYSPEDAVLAMKMTLMHEGTHAADDAAGKLGNDAVENDKSARKEECKLFEQIKSKFKSAELRDKLQKSCDHYFNPTGAPVKPGGTEELKQLSYKEEAHRDSEARGQLTLTFGRLGLQFSYDGNWQLFNRAEPGKPGALFDLGGPVLRPPRTQAGTLRVVVEPIGARGGRFDTPQQLAAFILDQTPYARVTVTPTQRPVAGFPVDALYTLIGSRKAPHLERNEYSNEFQEQMIEEAARTPVDRSRRLLAARRHDWLIAIYGDTDADLTEDPRAAPSEAARVAESLKVLPIKPDDAEVDIDVAKAGVSFPAPIEWSIDSVGIEDGGGFSVRVSGPIGPQFTQPSITVTRTPLGGRSLDAVADQLSGSDWGIRMFLRPSTLGGVDARVFEHVFGLRGPGVNVAEEASVATLEARSAVTVTKTDVIQVRAVDNLNADWRCAAFFDRARAGLRIR